MLDFCADDHWLATTDAADPLCVLRQQFVFPVAQDGSDVVYFAGHSLGLQPINAKTYVLEALDDWARYAVDGHFLGRHPWLPYHELLTGSTARLMGALPSEVVVMNTLTVNLHLMMTSFYRPTPERFRIVIESGAFPSDRYAVASQASMHGFDPALAVVELTPRPDEPHLRQDDVLRTIERLGDSVAMVVLGNCNYLTGQAFDMPALTRAGHAKGCIVGFDLAHGAGNLDCQLHDSGADFAVWCNYKYLNAGPGGLGAVFIHQRHHHSDVPRLAGWWGHTKASRFDMGPRFESIVGAEGWQLSNPPILQLAALRAAMEPFDQAGISALRARGDRLTAYLLWWLNQLPPTRCRLLTPRDSRERGSMLTLQVYTGAEQLTESLHRQGITVDLRRPDIVRLTPAPLYSRFTDVARVGKALLAELAN